MQTRIQTARRVFRSSATSPASITTARKAIIQNTSSQHGFRMTSLARAAPRSPVRWEVPQIWASAGDRTRRRSTGCECDPLPRPTSITMAGMVVGYHRLDGRQTWRRPRRGGHCRPRCQADDPRHHGAGTRRGASGADCFVTTSSSPRIQTHVLAGLGTAEHHASVTLVLPQHLHHRDRSDWLPHPRNTAGSAAP